MLKSPRKKLLRQHAVIADTLAENDSLSVETSEIEEEAEVVDSSRIVITGEMGCKDS